MMVFGSGGRADSYPIVFHEYAHYLVHLNSRAQLPIWLNEGLAEFYSTFEPDYKGRGLVGRPPTNRLRELRGVHWIPLREVVSPPDMEKLWRSNEQIALFYAEAWALVHYLIVARETPTRSPFDAYLKALARASSQDAAFVEAFGVNVNVMDRELQRYVKRYIFNGFSLPQSAGSVGPAMMEPVSEADVHQIQGQLLAGVGSVEEAEKELQVALEIDPMHVDSRVSMASLRIDQDRPDEAIELLSQVTEKMPDYVPALYHLGRARLYQWQAEGAVTAFERATKVNANHTHAWLGLSAAALMMNRDSQSRAALSQAMALEANPGHYYAHARTALRIGRNDVAAAAAHSYIDHVGLADSSAQYAAFLAAIAHWREGRPSEADAILATAQSAIASGTWAAVVLQFLRGQLDAEQLLAKAKTNGERTEAHTYVGFKQDIAGRHEEALTHFRWVAEQGARNYTEYSLARNELARLRHAAVAK
jgi:tetratricopeptide (TPR) repeat protein